MSLTVTRLLDRRRRRSATRGRVDRRLPVFHVEPARSNSGGRRRWRGNRARARPHLGERRQPRHRTPIGANPTSASPAAGQRADRTASGGSLTTSCPPTAEERCRALGRHRRAAERPGDHRSGPPPPLRRPAELLGPAGHHRHPVAASPAGRRPAPGSRSGSCGHRPAPPRTRARSAARTSPGTPPPCRGRAPGPSAAARRRTARRGPRGARPVPGPRKPSAAASRSTSRHAQRWRPGGASRASGRGRRRSRRDQAEIGRMTTRRNGSSPSEIVSTPSSSLAASWTILRSIDDIGSSARAVPDERTSSATCSVKRASASRRRSR